MNIPNYNYNCQQCGNITLQRKMNDEEIKTCPTCKSEIQRVYGLAYLDIRCDGFFGKSK